MTNPADEIKQWLDEQDKNGVQIRFRDVKKLISISKEMFDTLRFEAESKGYPAPDAAHQCLTAVKKIIEGTQ